MTPAELTAARKALHMKATDLGRTLELTGDDPGRMVRLWEAGKHRIPGPAAVAIRLILEKSARQSLQDAVEQAQGILTPPDPLPPVLDDPGASAPVIPLKTRRRG